MPEYRTYIVDDKHLRAVERDYSERSRVCLVESGLSDTTSLELAYEQAMEDGDEWVEYVVLPVFTKTIERSAL